MSTADDRYAATVKSLRDAGAVVTCLACGQKAPPHAALQKGTRRGFVCSDGCGAKWLGEPAPFGSNPEAL